MKKFVFVILHYYTIDDTKKCVESILANGKNKDIEIIIVDNASPNNSGVELKKIFGSTKKVHIILNKENLGFARGNNVGFKYAKDTLNPDFIIMCNNDTYLIDCNFFDLIEKEYDKSGFAVLGPKIILPDNKINDVILHLPTIKEVKKQLRNVRINYYTNLLFINGLYFNIKKIFKKILLKFKIIKSSNYHADPNKRYEGLVLHGSFLIFSKKYIEKFDGLNDRTFLYREEELLALRLKQSNLKSVYNPKIEIFHNEDSATNAISKNNRRKQLFVWKNMISSTKVLLNEMNTSESGGK